MSVLQQDACNEDFVRTEVTVITPDYAKHILENYNPKNRALKQKHVDNLAMEMKNKEWMLNGQTIIFSKNGMLLDGQHRLNACVKSGCSFETVVSYNVKKSTFNKIDGLSIPRTTADVLSIENIPYYTEVAAIAKIILKWEYLDNDNKHLVLTCTRFNKSDVTEFCLKRNDFNNSAEIARQGRRLCNPSLFGACYYICSSINQFQANLFFKSLCDLNLAMEIQQALCLRDKLLIIKSEQRTLKFKEIEIMALIIKSWNAYREGRIYKKLRWKLNSETNEKFPLPR